MAGFVGSSAFLGSKVVSLRPAVSRRSSARTSTLSMKVKDFEVWKTEWAGGFPGGEGFFKQWAEEGMEGDVPGLEKELQPTSPNQGTSIIPPAPTPSDASVAAAAKLRGEAPPAAAPAAAAAAAPAAAAAAAPAAASTGEDAAAAPVVIRAAGSVTPSVAPSTPAAPAASTPAVTAPATATPPADGPDPSLYMANYQVYPVNVAPVISISYDKAGARADDGVGLSMQALEGNAADLYYPAQYKNKAPVITIDYTPGSPFTAGVGLSMPVIDGPPTVAAPAAKGEVETKLTTDPYTGNLKLDFSVDGSDVNVYSDPRCTEAYDSMIGRK